MTQIGIIIITAIILFLIGFIDVNNSIQTIEIKEESKKIIVILIIANIVMTVVTIATLYIIGKVIITSSVFTIVLGSISIILLISAIMFMINEIIIIKDALFYITDEEYSTYLKKLSDINFYYSFNLQKLVFDDKKTKVTKQTLRLLIKTKEAKTLNVADVIELFKNDFKIDYCEHLILEKIIDNNYYRINFMKKNINYYTFEINGVRMVNIQNISLEAFQETCPSFKRIEL